MIREEILNFTVWKAISEVLVEPGRVMDQVTRRRSTQHTESSQRMKEQKDAERELARVHVEESRILEAYRLGAISPAQLGRELELLKRRELVSQQRIVEIEEDEPTVSPQNVEKSVREYCNEISQSLRSLDQPSKQQLLRTLIQEIVFEGERIRIRGQFPISDRALEQSRDPHRPPPGLIAKRRIVPTTVGHCGRNAGREDSNQRTRVVKSSRYPFCAFEIACGIAQAERRRQPRDTLGRFSGPL
jgi:hypothetical protein